MNNSQIALSDVILELYPNSQFSIINDDYNLLCWHEGNTVQKPTLQQINIKMEELKLLEPMKRLREDRNIKLLETDKYSIPDWPHQSEEIKQSWMTYRQALRDLPQTAQPQLDSDGFVTNVTWPTPPS